MFRSLRDVQNDVRDALIKLDGPDTESTDVAERLFHMGIKGVPQEGEACPIAEYLKEVVSIPEDVVVAVDMMDVRVQRYGSGYGYGYPASTRQGQFLDNLTIITPQSIATFIREFDDGHFSELNAIEEDGGY